MKLKKLTLENFRSFKGKHEIEFSPITLLFGGNSVGKSSITKAIKNYDNLSREDVFHGEKSVSVRLDYEEVRIQSDCDAYTCDAPFAIQLVQVMFKDEDPFAFFAQFAKSCNSGSIKRKYVPDSELQQWVYGINDVWFLEIQDENDPEINGYTWEKSTVKFNLEHPILKNNSLNKSITNLSERFSELEGQSKVYTVYLLQSCLDKLTNQGPIKHLAEALAHEGEKLRYLMLDISRLVLVIRALKDALEMDVEHLGPLRKIPDLASSSRVNEVFNDLIAGEVEIHNHKNIKDKSVYTGESAWNSLSSHYLRESPYLLSRYFGMKDEQNYLGKDVNDWLLNWFNTPYEIMFFESYSLEIDSEEKRERFQCGQISKEDLSSSDTKVRFKNVQNGSITPASEIGVGISQLTPVIVNAINTKRFSVEQPELHIHPRMQTIVADLFVFEGLYKQAEKDQASVTIQTKNLDGTQKERSFARKNVRAESFILVETHSEHLMLRLLKRVREEILKPEDLAIYYFENDNGQTKATKIGVDEEGEFTTAWPQGFFEERLEELF